MIHSVEGLFEVNKNSTCKSFIIKKTPYSVSDTKQSMIGLVFFPKAELKLVNDIIVIQKLLKFVVIDTFKNFTDVREEGNRPIILTLGFLTFFKDWANQSRLQ